MKPIFIGSVSAAAGKSLLTFGIGMHYLNLGKSVGYFKPIGMRPVRVGGIWTEQDAFFASTVFEQAVPLGDVCPVVLSPEELNLVYKGKVPRYLPKVRKAFKRVSLGRDVVLVEGSAHLLSGGMMELPTYKLVKDLGTRLLLVTPYNDDSDIDMILSIKDILKDHMAGIVFNKVQRDRIDHVSSLVMEYLAGKKVRTFGIIPKDRQLASLTAEEIAEAVGGEVLCCKEFLYRTAERIFVGAMNVDLAIRILKQYKNKCVVVGGDRTDIQSAALETDTACLILTGGLHPNDIILSKADDVDIPLILVRDDTYTVVEKLERAFGSGKLENKAKVKRGTALVEKHLNFEALEKAFE